MERMVPRVEQMRDAQVVEWTLSQLAAARSLADDERYGELGRLLPAPVARYWLEQSNGVVGARLMEELPDAVVEELAPELEARFLELEESLARQFVLRLARLAPVRALSLLEEVVARVGGPKDALTLAFVVKACGEIGPAANALLTEVIRLCTDDDSAFHLYWSGLFGAMARVGTESLPAQVVRALIVTDGPGIEGQSILTEIFQVLAPGCPFLDMLFDVEYRHTGYRFGDLPELFRAEAPVEELDRLAESLGDARLDQALRRLPQVGPDNGIARFVRNLVEALPAQAPKGVRRLVFLSVIAAAAAQYQCHPEGYDQLPYEQLVDVTTADVSQLPHEEALLDQLINRAGQRELSRLHQEIEIAREFRGAARLVRVLAELRHASSIQPLLWCLDDVTDEAAANLAVVALARYGEAVFDPISNAWEHLDEFARMRALEVLGLVGSPAAADHLLAFFKDVQEEELARGAWCEAAEAVPDPRYLTLLDTPRHKRNDELRRTYDRVKRLVA